MRVIFLALLLSALSLNGFSQNGGRKMTITGTVLDVSGAPVSNAIVMVDGKETHSLTSQTGKYRVRVPAGAETIGILTFGNGIIGENIEGRNVINFRFTAPVLIPEELRGNGDDAVNTGYSTVRRKDMTTEVSKVDGRKKNYSSYSSIFDMIERECSGVRVSNGTVIIQDSKKMMGSVPPLYVVDGVYVDNISSISPSTVESIEVLKGTAASIYGSRGFGGAIIITTKTKNY